MIDMLQNISIGFGVALTPLNLLYCFLGVSIGTLIGVLPGIGPVATIAMLLPFTFKLPSISALIMLAGIYYGAQYGGSTTSILVNMPGEASSVVTCLDGYAMTLQGRAGSALGIAAIGSFTAGCLTILLIAFFAPPLAELAFRFSAAEYFSLMILGLISAVILAHGSVFKAIAMIFIGLLLGLVGTDVISGIHRFTFQISELSDGIEFAPLAMGLFGFSEIIRNLEGKSKREIFVSKIKSIMPTWFDIKVSWKPIIRGSLIGSMLGILPGGGAILSSFTSYTVEKKLSKNPERFGKGAIEGVAGPESANNAGAQMSFIPLLTLGIPPNAVIALMFGAMMIHGIIPGPNVINECPQLFWGLVASMWIGNLMLVILNLPLIRIWVQLLKVPYRFLYPSILLFCCIGIYSINNSIFDIILTIVFGLLGYIFLKTGCEPAPLLLGFILGPLMEENFRRAMLYSRGNPFIFLNRPISLSMLIIAALLLLLIIIPSIRGKREKVFKE